MRNNNHSPLTVNAVLRKLLKKKREISEWYQILEDSVDSSVIYIELIIIDVSIIPVNSSVGLNRKVGPEKEREKFRPAPQGEKLDEAGKLSRKSVSVENPEGRVGKVAYRNSSIRIEVRRRAITFPGDPPLVSLCLTEYKEK
jgi:hypothetical protein